MHECYLKVLEEMGYNVVSKRDKKEISITDNDGNELDSKTYYLEEINTNVIKFTDKINNREISLYNGIVEIKIDDISTAILSYDDDKKIHTFYVKYNVPIFYNNVTSIKIKVCNNRGELPGYVSMIINDNCQGTIAQEITSYNLSGGSRDSKSISLDNYMKYIDYIMLQPRLAWDEKLKKGYDIIIPGVRVCVGEMINYWVSHLNDYLSELEKKRCELQKEINYYNRQIRSITKSINRFEGEKTK